MGITIHYKGNIKSMSLIDQLQKEMVDICESMNWKYHLLNEDLNKPFSAELIHTERGAEIEGHIPLKGIIITTDPNNESLDLLFTPKGQLSSFMLEILLHEGTLDEEMRWCFVKTQFGPIDAHIAIVKLLDYMKKKYVPDLEVKDDGEYWETLDRERLMGKRGFISGKMAQFEKALSAVKFDHEPSREEVLEKIDEVIKRMMKKKI